MLLIALAPATMTLALAREVDQCATSDRRRSASRPTRPSGRATISRSRRGSTSSKVAPNPAQDPPTVSFSMTSCARVPRCKFSQQVLAHFIQSGRRPAQVCVLFAEQGIGYALWPSGQVHHRVVLFGGDVACSRDQTPRNLRPLVQLSQAVTRACPVDGTIDVLTGTSVFCGVHLVCPFGARSNTCYLGLGETQETCL